MSASFPGYFLQRGRGFDVVDNTYATWTLDPSTNQLTMVPWITNTVVATNAIDNTQLADMAQATVKGRAAGAGTGDPQDLTAAQLAAIVGSAMGANPTASVGLTAVNGVAATYLRSDAAPALDTSISPTMSGSWTFSNVPAVPNDSWTYAKIQNVSATSRVLGRITAGAGDIEELTGANVATIIGTALGANPSASVGLSAVNGTAATYMRSDAAPALSQSISPTMTGAWLFNGPTVTSTATPGVSVGQNTNHGYVVWVDTAGVANSHIWRAQTGATTLVVQVVTDAGATADALKFTRSTSALSDTSIGNATDNPTAQFLGTGLVSAGGGIQSSHATAGVGYKTGAGGTVTQLTSRTTGVTINKVCGEITLFSAAGSTTPASFTVTNSAVAATDLVVLNQKSGTDKYELDVTATAAGSFEITFNTKSGTTVEQPVFKFAVIKGVAA